MEFAVKSLVNSWLEEHPLIIWLLQHPIISLISFFLIIVLVFRLFSAIAKLLDQLWIWLLTSPVILIKSLLGLKHKSKENLVTINQQQIAIDSIKISHIIEQLELINQQQKQIMQEIAALKKEQK